MQRTDLSELSVEDSNDEEEGLIDRSNEIEELQRKDRVLTKAFKRQILFAWAGDVKGMQKLLHEGRASIYDID